MHLFFQMFLAPENLHVLEEVRAVPTAQPGEARSGKPGGAGDMRLLTEIEVRQLTLMREAGGLTPDGEELYQRVKKGDLDYDGKYGDDE